MRLDPLFDEFERAWSAGERFGFATVVTPDVHYEDPFCPDPLIGVAALERHVRRLWKGLPDSRVSAAGPRLYDGDHVAAPVKLVGRHTEELEGIAPTGRRVVLHAIFYCQLDEPGERIARVRAFVDRYDAGLQLGVLPEPGSFRERALLAMRGFGLRNPGR